MFPRSKINFLYRLLCFIAFLIVIVFIRSNVSLFIITLAFYILTIVERRFENVFLYIVTAIIFVICLALKNYVLLRIITVIDYINYFLNVDTLGNFEDIDDEAVNIKRDEHYIRFKTKKERVVYSSDKLCTIFVLVHMCLLLFAIVVG